MSRARLSHGFAALVWLVLLAAATGLAGGCAHVSTQKRLPPGQVPKSLEASKADLIEKYNRQAAAIQSLNATVTLTPTAGSQYSGVIEEYHEVKGFILAQRPASIRVIGQAPVVAKNIFDMVSDGSTFRVFIPSKHKFITGPAQFEKKADKPIENLRPQHLTDALFWQEIPQDAPVVFEETEDDAGRAYILTVLKKGESPADVQPVTQIRFDRTDLNVSELQNFGADGRLNTLNRYADWQPAGSAQFARSITVERPHDDYKLGIRITKLTTNETIAPERFHLEQPPGTELVEVGKEQGAQP